MYNLSPFQIFAIGFGSLYLGYVVGYLQCFFTLDLVIRQLAAEERNPCPSSPTI